MSLNDEKYIFYLKQSEKLPNWFIKFSQEFSKYDVRILPVSLQQLKVLTSQVHVAHVIFLESSFNGRKWLKGQMKGFLGLAIRSKKVKFYHITSFNLIMELSKYRLEKSYFYYRLPMKISILSRYILSSYLNQFSNDNQWPGGKSANLSDSIQE